MTVATFHPKSPMTQVQTVAVIQQLLRAHGFSVPVDGDAGEATRAALHRFQRTHGYLESGPDAAAVQALRGVVAPSEPPAPVASGDSHGHVHLPPAHASVAPPAPALAPSRPLAERQRPRPDRSRSRTPTERRARRVESQRGPSELTAQEVAEARHIIIEGARWMEDHADAVNYTELGLRWSAINEDRRIADGQYLQYGDCSSTATWLLWNGLTHRNRDFPDIVNGAQWRYGWTGTIARHGRRVPSLRQLDVGDLILYGTGYPYRHVTVALGDGKCFSHGTQAGPFIMDVLAVTTMPGFPLGPMLRFL